MSTADHNMPLIGVLGGMGPLASAAFMDSIYELDPPPCEQEAPRLVLWSDPAIVDRSRAIAAGELDALQVAVQRAVDALLGCGVDRIVMACVTAHAILGQLRDDTRDRIESLIDVVFDELGRRREPYLLVTTTGSRAARVFEGHGRWSESEQFLLLPAEDDQHRLHELLYRLKRNDGIDDTIDFLRDAVARAGACGFVAGCTELHLVTRAMARTDALDELRAVDPLTIVAGRIRAGSV